MYNGDPGFSSSGKDFLSAFLKGSEDYRQSGTDIPSFGIRRSYVGGLVPGEEPHFNEQIAATPSFDVNKPYIPGQQDYTGIPNATPEMLRRLQQRKTRNPGGQEDLPGFLKPV